MLFVSSTDYARSVVNFYWKQTHRFEKKDTNIFHTVCKRVIFFLLQYSIRLSTYLYYFSFFFCSLRFDIFRKKANKKGEDTHFSIFTLSSWHFINLLSIECVRVGLFPKFSWILPRGISHRKSLPFDSVKAKEEEKKLFFQLHLHWQSDTRTFVWVCISWMCFFFISFSFQSSFLTEIRFYS